MFFLALKFFNFFLQNLVPKSILIKNVKKFLKSVHNFYIYPKTTCIPRSAPQG